MILKYYIDTSVFGGLYDVEFQEFTKILFESIWVSDLGNTLTKRND